MRHFQHLRRKSSKIRSRWASVNFSILAASASTRSPSSHSNSPGGRLRTFEVWRRHLLDAIFPTNNRNHSDLWVIAPMKRIKSANPSL